MLTLANLSGDPSQDYYADGMTDELITALAENRSLRVVSRTSAMQHKGVSRLLRKRLGLLRILIALPCSSGLHSLMGLLQVCSSCRHFQI